MKRQTLQALLLATLALPPVLAHADDRFGLAALEWRLGPNLGRGGHEIYFRESGERHWHRAPGTAIDVADGWVIGTDRRAGGYGIYRWNGRDWQRMPGAAVDIGGSYRNPWVVNDRGQRFVWADYGWREAGGYRWRDERREDRREDRREAWRDERRDDRHDNRRDNRHDHDDDHWRDRDDH